MCLVQLPHLRCNCFNLQCKLPWGYICSHCALLRCFLYVPYLFFVRYLDKVICVRCCRPFQPAGSPCGPGGGACPAGGCTPTPPLISPLLSPFTTTTTTITTSITTTITIHQHHHYYHHQSPLLSPFTTPLLAPPPPLPLVSPFTNKC